MIDLLRCTLPTPDAGLAHKLRSPKLTGAIQQALQAARRDPRFAAKALSRWFRGNRWLGSKERPIVADATYGVIRLENLLIRAGCRDDPEMITRYIAMVDGERLEGVPPASPAEDLAAALGLDFAIAKEWLDLWGPDDAASLAQTLCSRAPTVIRANTLLCTREALQTRLAEEGIPTDPAPHTASGLVLQGRANLEGSPTFREGWFEIQDTSSQRFVEAIPLSDGMGVLDLCAGAGGKSLALAARGAWVTAHDVRSDALKELTKRARRAKCEHVVVDEPGPAPLVVVDAPCSSIGRLRRDPALRWRLEAQAQVPLQRDLLETAADLVEPGGLIAYAVCSLLRAEYEVGLPGFEVCDHQVLWPHQQDSDGFSWTLLWQQT